MQPKGTRPCQAIALKGQYIQEHSADVMVMGADWAGKFDEFKPLCDVQYLTRTPSISTTEIIEVVRTPGASIGR